MIETNSKNESPLIAQGAFLLLIAFIRTLP